MKLINYLDILQTNPYGNLWLKKQELKWQAGI